MNCPKCHYEQNVENSECEKCGIIFSKYYSALNAGVKDKHPNTAESSPTDTQPSISFGDIFLYTKSEPHMVYLVGRIVIFIGILIWGVKFVTAPIESNYAGASFLHLVNLPFHEAGHIVFGFLGPFVASLGGTLGQLIMPLICASVLLLKTRDTFGASVCLWWFGQNFFDIAPYVNDARSLSLPLLGGNVGHSSPYGFHDWEYLLTEAGMLQYDHFLAKSLVGIGIIIFIISYAWGAILLFKQYKDVS